MISTTTHVPVVDTVKKIFQIFRMYEVDKLVRNLQPVLGKRAEALWYLYQFADPKEKIIGVILKQTLNVPSDNTAWRFPILVGQAVDD